MADDYSTLIDQAGQKWNVDPRLISTVIGVESSGNPNAVGPSTPYGKAVGLGQLIPATAHALGVSDPTDPRQAIPAVAQLLSQNLDRYGNVPDAVAAYHGGTDQANWGPKTQAYVQKVTSQYGAQQPAQSQSAPQQGAQLVDPFATSAPQHAAAAVPSPLTPSANSSQVDPFAGVDQQVAAQKSGQQDHGLLAQLGDAASAFGHHVMAPLHGAAQDIEHGVNAAVQAVAPNTDFAHAVQQTVNSDDAAVQRWEQQYQASTPDNAGSYAGAVAGEVVPAVVAGGTRLIKGGADLAANLAGRVGLGQGATTAAQLLGRTAASAGLGGALAATTPVTTPGDFADQKAQQIGTGLTVGAIAPAAGDAIGAVGGRAGNTLRSLVDPFTQGGQSRIAENTLLRFANGGPTQVNGAQLVAGSEPTLAEATGNAGIAGLQRTMRDLQPNAFAQREADNAAARTAQFENTSGTKVDIASAEQARDAQAAQQLGSVFQNVSQANPAPVLQTIDSILSGPGGQRSSVSSSLNRVRNMIQDPQSGVVQADPNFLYQSVRKEIGDMLDQRMANANPAGLQASRELLAVRDELDNAIDGAAPGFKQYLSDYASSSQPIDAMTHLQGLNLTDANGNITLAKVQNALNGISKQQAKPGVNNAKSVSRQQIDDLTSLRDDLLRQSNLGKGRTVGSATAQNLAFQNVLANALPGKVANLVGNAGPAGIGSAIGTGLGFAAGGPIGAAAGATIGGGAGKLAGGLLRGQNEAIQNRLLDLLLNPAAGGAALNSASGPAQQTIRNALVNRLLPYVTPATVSAGTAVGTRPALPQTP